MFNQDAEPEAEQAEAGADEPLGAVLECETRIRAREMLWLPGPRGGSAQSHCCAWDGQFDVNCCEVARGLRRDRLNVRG
jgi:hypothetical protein